MSPSSTPNGKHILLAEDNEDLALLVRRMLEQSGFEVARVGTADDVLPALIAEQPDLLLLDVMMPSEEGLDGFAICQQIREGTHRKLPIIIMSAITKGTSTSDEHMKRVSGADVYLHKPFDPVDLLGSIKSLLKLS